MHEAIAEALLCGNTEVALESLPGYVENLYSVIPDDESETTNLELQFKVWYMPPCLPLVCCALTGCLHTAPCSGTH